MRRILIFLILFAADQLHAQFFQIDTIKGTGPKEYSSLINADNKYIFPKFTSKTRPQVAKRINDDLTEEILVIKPGEVKKSIFENVWGDKDVHIPMRSDIAWDIRSNSAKLLSFNMSAEGCGAYCEHFTIGFTYNSKTGNRLSVDSIFGNTGARKLCDSLSKKRSNIINAFIDSVKLNLAKGNLDEESKARDQEMVEMYESCYGLNSSYCADDTEGLNFTVQGRIIIIVMERCSAHVNRALDELYEFNFEIPLTDWKNYLTPFGASLLAP